MPAPICAEGYLSQEPSLECCRQEATVSLAENNRLTRRMMDWWAEGDCGWRRWGRPGHAGIPQLLPRDDRGAAPKDAHGERVKSQGNYSVLEAK